MTIAAWKGEFGNEYAKRNGFAQDQIYARVVLWEKILAPILFNRPASFLEVGANIGLNIAALNEIVGGSRFYATEPNDHAKQTLIQTDLCDEVTNDEARLLAFNTGSIEFVFTSGVLIHIQPADLLQSCKEIHRVSSRYICSIEYFSDKPQEVEYRGNKDMLWKRDFGSYWMDQFPGLNLIHYGFEWKRRTGLDNLTWWLFEKQGVSHAA